MTSRADLPPDGEPVGSLTRDRQFLRLWAGQTASQVGAQTSQMMLPLVAVTVLGVGTVEVGVLRAVQQAPVLLLALLVGVWADRWARRTILVVSDLGRAAVLAAVPLSYSLGLLDVPVLYAVGLAVGICTVFFDVAYQAYLLRLVPRRHLPQGNALLESSRSAAQIGGPAIGGGMISLLAAPIAVGTSSIVFLLSALSLWSIRRPESVDESEERGSILEEMRAGLVLVGRNTMLRAIALSSGFFNLGFSAFLTIYLIFLPRELGLSGLQVGVCLAALGVGSLLGSLVSGVLPRNLGYGLTVVGSSVVANTSAVAVAAVHGAMPVTIVLLLTITTLFGAFAQIVNVGVTVVRQAVTPVAFQARVSATIRFVGLGLAPLGSLLGGALGAAFGLRAALISAAVTLFLSPMMILFSPLARLGTRLPEPPPS